MSYTKTIKYIYLGCDVMKNIFENYAFIISFQHLDGEYLCECVDEWVASVSEQIWHPKIDLFYFSRFLCPFVIQGRSQ